MIVVTGGTKGIGRAIIERFAQAGFVVATCARNLEELQKLKTDIENKYGTEVFIQSANLSVREDTNEFVRFVNRIEKNIQAIVNNAGVFIPGSIHSEEAGALEKMIETNLYSAYDITRGFIGDMIRRKEGHIFNICSIASIAAYPNGGSYAISKHAMYGFSKCLREEMKEHGIRVTAVLPGATLTASWEGVDLPEERLSTPEDVAELVFSAYKVSKRSVVEDIIIRPQLGDL